MNKPDERRNAVACNMFRPWYVPFYYYGVIHGDPHLGNYTVRPDNSINLYDLGTIRVFLPSFVKGVINLYFALRDNDPVLAVHAYETWGFKNPTQDQDIIAVLNLWARYVYASPDAGQGPAYPDTGGRHGRQGSSGKDPGRTAPLLDWGRFLYA